MPVNGAHVRNAAHGPRTPSTLIPPRVVAPTSRPDPLVVMSQIVCPVQVRRCSASQATGRISLRPCTARHVLLDRRAQQEWRCRLNVSQEALQWRNSRHARAALPAGFSLRRSSRSARLAPRALRAQKVRPRQSSARRAPLRRWLNRARVPTALLAPTKRTGEQRPARAATREATAALMDLRHPTCALPVRAARRTAQSLLAEPAASNTLSRTHPHMGCSPQAPLAMTRVSPTLLSALIRSPASTRPWAAPSRSNVPAGVSARAARTTPRTTCLAASRWG